ncbi:biotin--[acetyl-CoA-carboxylase] ligase [Paeniglutamicibacter psychrophenolicus]|uniref:biotin--[biotin carboxyl-carrier protein] ligase n=1 Tax=Paeniglutamicibacter psychrophenolicus TaxID=257454 RepID=A0ABS4WI36_9MICC|nr:biotin--[acetyl-CoA-carboxylase] ligase [Paeniglutamicibacter psychrophenolicus]MBP2375872.1 BirA family biotin operon repressor/biotin-[acetyl-CoA-carboxylase] ligase [Paeniglutamicibacter psychrophenolicus]
MSNQQGPGPEHETFNAFEISEAGRATLDAAALRRGMAAAGMGELWISEHTGSTNDDLAARAHGADLANLSVETTEHQMAGHGRLGRGWQTPARSALATSIYFRPGPGFDSSGLAWLSMLCAAAMVQTLREDASLAAGLKWPNDVVAEGKKVCGVLAQLVMRPEGPVVVVGAGLNVSLTAAELPVDTAASLGMLGAATLDRTELLGGYLRRVAQLFGTFEAAGGNASAKARYAVAPETPDAEAPEATLREVVRSVMVTIGHRVDAHLPNGTVLRGTAIDLDADGSLKVRGDDGTVHSVMAGDVKHLRRSDGSYA